VFKKYICNGVDVFERVQTIANIYDYQFYYDPDDSKVHFEPKGYLNTSYTLYVGGANNNVSNLPTWEFDNEQCVNKLTVKGAVQEVQDEEYFNGDGTANQEFVLSKKPSIVQVWEYVSGNWVLKVPGIESSTPGTFDYEIDKENKKITATDNWTPASGSNNVWINYTNSIPVPVLVEDSISQAKYGVYAKEMFFSDIQTVSDAEIRGTGYLDKYSEPFVRVMVKTTRLIDLDAGTRIRIVDSINNEDRELVINRVVKKFPYDGDELYLGDKEYKLSEWGMFTLERIRRLEEEVQKNVEQLLIIIRTANIDLELVPRYMKLQKSGLTGDGFLLDSPTLGVLDVNILDALITFNDTERVIWADEKYIETFYDEDFKGTSSGSPTWSTVSKELIL